jgi:hypothetical protein
VPTVARDVGDAPGGLDGPPSMKDRDLVSGADELVDDRRPDEPAAADEEEAHALDYRVTAQTMLEEC